MKRRAFLHWLAATSWCPAALPGIAAAAQTPIIAGRFGDIPPPGAIRRVAAAGGPASALLYALAPEKLIGWSKEMTPAALEYIAPAFRGLPVVGRIGGRGATAPAEALLKMNPDLIIDVGAVNDLYLTQAERTYRQTGIPTILVAGSLPDHAGQLLEVGRLLGVDKRAEMLAAYARDVLRRVNAVRESIPREKQPRIYYARGTNGLESGRSGSINIEVLEFVGGRNVTESVGEGDLARFSMEQLLAWNPQIIITQEADFAASVMKNPRWQGVDAVRNARVHLAPIYPFGWIDLPPSVNRLIGALWLQSLLFADHPLVEKNIHEAIRAFYRLFYGVELTTAAIRKLLTRA